MRFHIRAAAVGLAVIALSACGDIPSERVQVQPEPKQVTTTIAPEFFEAVNRNIMARTVEDAGHWFAEAASRQQARKNAPDERERVERSGSRAASAPSGSCYDQPWIPAYIITRESGGDPYIINGGGHAASPYLSGGRSWGCAQFMPGTWDANCRDLGFDVASQIECMRRVSNNGTNLRPWSL